MPLVLKNWEQTDPRYYDRQNLVDEFFVQYIFHLVFIRHPPVNSCQAP